MSASIPLSLSPVPSAPGRVLAGHWKLPAGRALSLYPREHGVLEITLGRVWVTQAGRCGASADHVLAAGERLRIEPGRHVVIEPWAGAGWPAAAFCWDAGLAPEPCAAPAPTDWDRSVAQPARELAQALAGAALAAAQVVRGLVRWAAGMPGGRCGAPCGG